jgi:hypothetical protein
MNPDGSRFKVEGAGQFPLQLEQLITIAEQRGLQSLLTDLLRQVSDNLQSQPRDWGDPYTNYRVLKAVGYGKTILPVRLRVEYVVHDTEQIVWIRSLRPLFGSPFA